MPNEFDADLYDMDNQKCCQPPARREHVNFFRRKELMSLAQEFGETIAGKVKPHEVSLFFRYMRGLFQD